MDTRELSTLPLAPGDIDLLIQAGFKFVSEVSELRPLDLARELNITADAAGGILKSIKSSTEPVVSGQTALDLIVSSSRDRPIISFCRELDMALGGGIPCGQITELCGVPGIGKTQLGIQLALDVQIPVPFKGRGGHAVYIDTEGSFMVERVAAMAEAVASHLSKIASVSAPDSEKAIAASGVTRDSLLEGIHVFRVLDQTELVAVINHLHTFLAAHPQVKLIVVDSIAFHFRQDLQDLPARNRALSCIAQTLNRCAIDYNYLSVVVINHVTSKVERGTGSSHIVPALGDQWSHCVTNRIMLQWKSGQRMAYLIKSPNRPMASAAFAVTSQGVRDVQSERSAHHQSVDGNGHNSNFQGEAGHVDKKQRV